MQLFIANVSYNAQESDLRTLLEKYGEVSQVKMATDRETGRFRGFAFATFVDENDATKAIRELDGQDFFERALVVKEAEKREPKSPRQGRSNDRFNRDEPRREKRSSRDSFSRDNYYN